MVVFFLGGGDDDFEVVNGMFFVVLVVLGLVVYLCVFVVIKDFSRFCEFDDLVYVKEFIWSN